jgi:hypothetical protein
LQGLFLWTLSGEPLEVCAVKLMSNVPTSSGCLTWTSRPSSVLVV